MCLPTTLTLVRGKVGARSTIWMEALLAIDKLLATVHLPPCARVAMTGQKLVADSSNETDKFGTSTIRPELK